MKLLSFNFSDSQIFILFRYFLFGFIGLEVLLIPLIFESKEIYANGEYFKSFIALMPLLLIGLHSGFFRTKFIDKFDASSSLIFASIILLLPISIFSAIYFDNIFLLFAISSFSLAISLEKIYQLKKMFKWALLFKPLFSIFYILISFIFINLDISIVTFLSISYILSVLIFSIPYLRETKIKFNITNITNIINDTLRLIKNGFWINLGTLFVGGLILLDRHMLKVFDIESLADFSFAFNFSSFLFAYFTSLSFINDIYFGEKINSFKSSDLLEMLKIVIKHLAIGLLITSILYLFIIYFIPKYSSSLEMYFVISFCWGSFYCLGTLGPLVQYLNLQKHLGIILTIIGLTTSVSYYCIFKYEIKFDSFYLISKTGFVIFLFAIYQISYIYKKLKIKNG